MTDTSATLPPQPQTWDPESITNEALSILRLDALDPDADRVATAALVACQLCDQLVDKETSEAPTDSMREAAVFLTVEMYRRKDAPFGVLNAWSTDDIAFRLGSDVMRSVRAMLFPFKSRFGVA